MPHTVTHPALPPSAVDTRARTTQALAIPQVSPAAPAAPSTGDSVIQQLLQQTQGLLSSGQPTSTATTTQTTQAERSPELEQSFTEATGRLNELSQGFTGAFEERAGGFNDIIRELTNIANREASRQPRAVSTAALSSGLSPVEAAGAGADVRSNILQSFLPQLATLRGQQANVGVELQQALQGVGRDQTNLLALIAPYQQAIAGTTGTTTQTSTDQLESIQLLSTLAVAVDQSNQQWQQIQLQGRQLDLQSRELLINQRMEQDRIELQQWLSEQEQAGADRRQLAAVAGERELQILRNAQQTSERLGTQTANLERDIEQTLQRIEINKQAAEAQTAGQLEVEGVRGARETEAKTAEAQAKQQQRTAGLDIIRAGMAR